MSWSVSVPLTAKADFDAAVDAAFDAAVASGAGQPPETPGLADDMNAARESMKALAQRVKRNLLRGSAGGHCLSGDEGSSWSDGLNVSVSGYEPRD